MRIVFEIEFENIIQLWRIFHSLLELKLKDVTVKVRIGTKEHSFNFMENTFIDFVNFMGLVEQSLSDNQGEKDGSTDMPTVWREDDKE